MSIDAWKKDKDLFSDWIDDDLILMVINGIDVSDDWWSNIVFYISNMFCYALVASIYPLTIQVLHQTHWLYQNICRVSGLTYLWRRHSATVSALKMMTVYLIRSNFMLYWIGDQADTKPYCSMKTIHRCNNSNYFY